MAYSWNLAAEKISESVRLMAAHEYDVSYFNSQSDFHPLFTPALVGRRLLVPIWYQNGFMTGKAHFPACYIESGNYEYRFSFETGCPASQTRTPDS